MVDQLLGYIAVFFAAAIPWVELIVVIPPAIALGLNPVAVGVIAFAGNALPVAGIIAAERQLIAAWKRWRPRIDAAVYEATGRRFSMLAEPQELSEVAGEPSPAATEGDAEQPRRGWRQRLTARVVHRYGVPGLALVAPATTGIHLATLMALAFRAPRIAVLVWMVASLAIWAAVTTVLTALGVSLFR